MRVVPREAPRVEDSRAIRAIRTLDGVKHLRAPSHDELRTLVAAREGETRIGQRAAAFVPGAPPPKGARLALVGVPEDIGVRANLNRELAASKFSIVVTPSSKVDISDGSCGHVIRFGQEKTGVYEGLNCRSGDRIRVSNLYPAKFGHLKQRLK